MKKWVSLAPLAMGVGAAASIIGMGSAVSAGARPVPTPPRAKPALIVTINPAALEDWGMSCANAGCKEMAIALCDWTGGTWFSFSKKSWGGGSDISCEYD